ncbi:MAG: hypothetical protein N3B16_07255 [Candidatus Aminicenantes bacterium]|nr:hypothetical protein [Candidatus Aminicenantes bacterium]
MLGQLVGELFDDLILKEKGFDNDKIFFEYFRQNLKEKIVVAIDDFP